MIKKFKKVVCLVAVSAMMLTNLSCAMLKGVDVDTESKTTEQGTETTGEPTTIEITTAATKTDFTDAELAEQDKFEKYCDDYFEDQITGDYMSYHYFIKDGSKFGLEEPAPNLGSSSMTDDSIKKEAEDAKKGVDELKAIDYNALTEDQQFDYDVLLMHLENVIKVYDNIYLYEPFSPMNGLHANISQYFTDFRFDKKEDVENYIACLKDTRNYFKGYLDFEKVKSEKGFFMSDASADQVIEQCEDFLSNRDDHFMIAVFNNNIEGLTFLTEEEKQEYRSQNEDAVKNYLLPAFEDTKSTFESLKGTGKNQGGLCGYEGGKEYYEYLFFERTGSAKTPDEAIEKLESEVPKLMASFYAIYAKNPDAYEYFVNNEDELFKDVDNLTPTEMINKLMEVSTADYPAYKKIPFRAEYLDKSLEKIQEGVLAYCLSPAIDDPDNNLIRVNGLKTKGLWSTLAHEGYPGHMFQNSYYMDTNPRNFRSMLSFLGYKEGWAMYTCYAAIADYDFSSTGFGSELADLYQLNEELSYLVMGIIDLRVNYSGWTLDEVKDYLNSNGFNGDAAQELFDTLSGDPALYQSYVMGYYEMKEMREYAEAQLQDKFDVVEFNKTVLDAGPCEYALLKKKVDKYIVENR